MSDFVNIKLNNKNLDIYHARNSIFKAIEDAIPNFKGNLLDVGCGKMPYKNYILENSEINNYVGLDIETALEYDKYVKPDLLWDGKKMPIKDNSYNTIIATEVLEHCFEPEILLKEIYRVLKPGGLLFFTVPFVWNFHETPYDAYRYTPFALERHLLNSGFKDIKIKATGGWHAAMAQMLGLWIKRSPMSLKKRRVFSKIGIVLIKYLLKKETTSTVSLSEGQMITGLYGIIKKNNV